MKIFMKYEEIIDIIEIVLDVVQIILTVITLTD